MTAASAMPPARNSQSTVSNPNSNRRCEPDITHTLHKQVWPEFVNDKCEWLPPAVGRDRSAFHHRRTGACHKPSGITLKGRQGFPQPSSMTPSTHKSPVQNGHSRPCASVRILRSPQGRRRFRVFVSDPGLRSWGPRHSVVGMSWPLFFGAGSPVMCLTLKRLGPN
jgi:hypothetical protein